MSKILIIEDEEAIADLEKDYLELSGFEVEIENRGDVGLKRALETDYNLFILDLMLPEMDGFEICKEIRNHKNTPIIMVSAKKDDIDKIRGLGLGADDYMTKPFRICLRHRQIAASASSSSPTSLLPSNSSTLTMSANTSLYASSIFSVISFSAMPPLLFI